jgi:predicted phage terminase large subunit-like protein
LLFFAWYYFSETTNADNAGNWEGFDIASVDQAPQFHREICDIMDRVSNEETNAKVAVAAPRSHAKSSYLSKAFPLHEVVFRKRKYVIVISETPAVAGANIEWIKLQLASNEKLRRDFGGILSPKQQMNPKDNSSEFIAWEPRDNDGKHLVALVQAASSGQALRGRNWNGVRPDLIVCDDLEDKRNTNTEELRQEMKDWFTKVVVPLGDPKGKRTAIVFMGTTVHPQALLIDVLYNRSDFKSKKYQAIIEQPKRADLWQRCQEIYTDRNNPDRARDAELFYIAHREEMNEGALVLWPEVQPIWKLMTWKWDNGSRAFNTEYMNNPVDEEDLLFNPEKFQYYNPMTDFLDGQYRISLAVDMAMGKERGDYSALAVVAEHKKTKTKFVVDSYGERLHPDKFIDVIIEKTTAYQPDIISAEAQAAQEFFVDILTKRLQASGYPAKTRLRKVKQRNKKALRIEAMQPIIETGELQFNKRHSLLLEQFEQYGTTHDDLPDALEMAVTALKSRERKITKSTKRMR